MSNQRINLGKQGEDIAAEYLRSLGFQIKARNYRQKSGEIDIICRDGDTLVFVEVKTRKDSQFGHPAESVTSRKQQQISHTALVYLSTNNLHNEAVRFDVIGVICSGASPDITHIVDAFEGA